MPELYRVIEPGSLPHGPEAAVLMTEGLIKDRNMPAMSDPPRRSAISQRGNTALYDSKLRFISDTFPSLSLSKSIYAL